jgi:hypothetical protein
VTDGPVSLEIQGRRLFVAHGDGLGSGDTGYKILKKILRNRAPCSVPVLASDPDFWPIASRSAGRHGAAR